MNSLLDATESEDLVKSDESMRIFSEGFNCAQSVFVPFAEEYGLRSEDGNRISSSFGAGMGRTQETCGAVTGGAYGPRP